MESQVSYQQALDAEDTMRAVMYTEGFEEHEINTNEYYNLIPLTEALWNTLQIGRSNDDDMLFRQPKDKHGPLPCKASWEQVQSKLTDLNFLFEAPLKNIFIAGGAIFSILFCEAINDTDCFLYGIGGRGGSGGGEGGRGGGRSGGDKGGDDKAAEDTVKQFIDTLSRHHNHDHGAGMTCFRTKNSISVEILSKPISPCCYQYRINHGFEKYQVILRLYRTPSEILHGFDVDCCCMGYDGKQVWLTQRCLASLVSGYNTVNFDRLSPTYERRLAKYGARGISIKVPNFNRKNIDHEKLMEFADKYNKEGDEHYSIRARKLQGLAILLYTDYGIRLYRKTCTNLINKMNAENSDYDNAGKVLVNGQSTCTVSSFLDHMIRTAKDYPKSAAQYLPILGVKGEVMKGEGRSRNRDGRRVRIKVKNSDNNNHGPYPFTIPVVQIPGLPPMPPVFPSITPVKSVPPPHGGNRTRQTARKSVCTASLPTVPLASQFSQSTPPKQSVPMIPFFGSSQAPVPNIPSPGFVPAIPTLPTLVAFPEPIKDLSLRKRSNVFALEAGNIIGDVRFLNNNDDITDLEFLVDKMKSHCITTLGEIRKARGKSEDKDDANKEGEDEAENEEVFDTDKYEDLLINPMNGKLIPIFFIMQIIHDDGDLNIFKIEPKVYDAIGIVRKWDLPRCMEFKKINPGEQTTSTFNSIVLKDRKVWYTCDFYRAD